MTKDNLTILQIENDPYYRINLELLLERIGLTVSRKVWDTTGLRAMLAEVEAGKFKPDVAIIDNYLARDYTDGPRIAEKLRALQPKIKIIAYTVMRDTDATWADAYAIKSGLDNERTIYKALSLVTGMKISMDKIQDVEND